MRPFPCTPRLVKGAIIGLDPMNPLASVVVFQYNPDTMTRRLEACGMNSVGGAVRPFVSTGPPEGTVTLEADWKWS